MKGATYEAVSALSSGAPEITSKYLGGLVFQSLVLYVLFLVLFIFFFYCFGINIFVFDL